MRRVRLEERRVGQMLRPLVDVTVKLVGRFDSWTIRRHPGARLVPVNHYTLEQARGAGVCYAITNFK